MVNSELHRGWCRLARTAVGLALLTAACERQADLILPPTPPPMPEPTLPPIGTASMREDGTIILQLRATDGKGALGDAQLVYPKSHPQYPNILAHLGGLTPGQRKPVPPFPEAGSTR